MAQPINKELVVKAALEVLQNVLPTNIMENLDRLDAEDDDQCEEKEDLDEDRFIFEHFQTTPENHMLIPKSEPVDNKSLTYFEIVEQEMMMSLPVTRDTIELLKLILGNFTEINQSFITNMNVNTIDQLTNILVYSLMSTESMSEIENSLFLETGTVQKVLEGVCGIIAPKKDTFIPWPNADAIHRSVRQFEQYDEFGHYEFYNVFGAVGTLDLQVTPPLSKHLIIPLNEFSYTPIKWQCSCDCNGFLQSSFVIVPKRETESKNSYVFEVNPLSCTLEAMKSSEVYIVADETLTLFPFLLTPHEKLIIRADEHNRALESKRLTIDKTFAKIQHRFFILNQIELRNVTHIEHLIDTVGILHNFFMLHNDSLYVAE